MNTFVINSIVLKVVAPCNLNCSYCYEYNRGDSTWKDMPKQISSETAARIGMRISEYASSVSKKHFQINLHGGEPTMLGGKGLERVITTLINSAKNVKLHFGMQTNATLISEEIVAVLVKYQVKVGVSLDGGFTTNRHRVDHLGRSTWNKTINGLTKIKEAGLLSGIQAVIDLDSDPKDVLENLSQFRPKIIDFSQPFGNHDNPPLAFGKKFSLGEWLTKAFDYWVSTPSMDSIRMGILADAVYGIYTEKPMSEWFPAIPPGFIVVSTGGSYEGLDALKVVGTEGRVLGLNSKDDSIIDALNHKFIGLRSQTESLCEECSKCSIVKWCSGGYFPTRYGKDNGFNNPSVYCEDLKILFSHIGKWLVSLDHVPDLKKIIISEKLNKLQLSKLSLEH